MSEFPSVSIENITYTHDELPSFFMLDQLLNRMAPISALTGPSPQQVIGSLAIFPIEVLLIILENLAVTDVMRFRRCSRFAMHVVDTESPFHSCLQLVPIIVKGMMAIRTSAHITPQQLRAKLRHRYCNNIRRKYFDEDINTNPEYEWAQCGQMVQHLYLPTCMRLCLECRNVQTGLDYEMAAVSGVVEPKVFAMAASFRLPPVTLMHGLKKFKVEAHQKLHNRTSILKVKKDFPPAIDPATDEFLDHLDKRYRRECALEKPNKTGRHSITIIPAVPWCYRPAMSTVFASLIDPVSSQVEQGFYCTSCLHTRRYQELFTREEFFKHLKNCRVRPFMEYWNWMNRLRLDLESYGCDSGGIGGVSRT
jgi:hypothetical protein